MAIFRFIQQTLILPSALWLLSVSYSLANHTAGHTGSTPDLEEVELINPLKNIATIDGLLVAILNILMILMVPIIVFFIILAGFKYVTARGNASQVEEATKALTYAIIGGVLILGAVAISEIIKNVVESF